jgi:hypothetical protein
MKIENNNNNNNNKFSSLLILIISNVFIVIFCTTAFVEVVFVVNASITTTATSSGVISALNAIEHDEDVNNNSDNNNNVFLQRKAKADAHFYKASNKGVNCKDDDNQLHLKWRTRVQSSVYASPLVVDMHGDGHKEILVNTFVHAIDLLDGETGQTVAAGGFPIFHESKIHGSPILYRDEQNGEKLFIICTYDGEILVFNQFGSVEYKRKELARMKVPLNWFKEKERERKQRDEMHIKELKEKANAQKHAPGDWEHSGFDSPDILHREGREPPPVIVENNNNNERRRERDGGRKLLEAVLEDIKFTMDEDIVEGEDLYRDEDYNNDDDDDDNGNELYNDENDETIDNKNDYHSDESVEDEIKDELRLRETRDKDNVYIDAHILCSPVIADVDGDGHMELVIAVSYFFDEEREDFASKKHRLNNKIDASKYLATAIVLLDIKNEYREKEFVHLDLSVEDTAFKARAFSQPTVIDLDKDGTNEIILATSTGNVYVLNGKTLENKKGFPKQMGEIQAPVVVADFNNDGYYEVIACDLRGNVGVFTKDGDILWEKHLQSQISANPTLGDIDGDHNLEVIIGTSSGAIHVLNAETGEEKYPFPFYTGGRILAPVALGRLKGPSSSSLSLVATAFDGLIYIIDGKTGCRNIIDLGETSYSMPLIDDLSNSGYLNVVVATMNGEVHCFENSKSGPHAHPLDQQHAHFLSTNLMTHRTGYFGIYGLDRGYFDSRGEFLTIKYRMIDNRCVFGSSRNVKNSCHGPYVVTVTLNAIDVQHAVKSSKYYEDVMTSVDQITLQVPRQKSRGEVIIEMKDGSGVIAMDQYSVSFHERHYRIIKWIVALPFLGLTYFMKKATEYRKIKTY